MSHTLKSLLSVFLLSVLLMGISFAAASPAPAQSQPNLVGQVVWAKGKIHAMLPSQADRTLQRRSPIYETDSIITGPDGGGQIVFTDQSTLALRSDTTLKIETYLYDKDAKSPSDQKLVLNLVKGGFRTVTGLVAKQNPKGYAIKTPVATIGVRGTVFSVVYNSMTQVLSTGVWKGSISVTNQAGSITLTPEAMQFAETTNHLLIPKPVTTTPAGLKTGEPKLQSGAKMEPMKGGGSANCVTIP